MSEWCVSSENSKKEIASLLLQSLCEVHPPTLSSILGNYKIIETLVDSLITDGDGN